MNNVVKLFVVASLAIGVFGGGSLIAYRLFFKRPDRGSASGNGPVVTPTPDPGIAMFDQAKQQIASGDQSNAQKILLSLIQSFPESIRGNDARKLLGDLNISEFFSSAPGSDKTEYIVARGDSIAKIATKTKDPAELIFKANGLDSLTIQPGKRLIIPKGQFSLVINTKRGDLTLVNNGNFFRWYKPLEIKLPAKFALGQFKMREKIAWSGGIRVAFGEKKYLGSSRWIVINDSGITLYSETNPQTPNVQKPGTGIMLGPADMEELFALVVKDTPVTVK
ncbi:MAG: LysM peptidoglycan-binding domain-containing protein [Verrucomicrobia bacterium]|nr:LysM peptidoglycan-binding domain-containing protein [Verrucomicrobiota bacterium]MBV9129641.1 LysM peptidoglycan-binding domain-containing protein [Verrucomicrobiota bacterium]MBV9643380.1 LysM peptidoglycan-binding domain-containing protein [Verrucomicrobiota bacterium]